MGKPLAERACLVLDRSAKALVPSSAAELLRELHVDWHIVEGGKLVRRFSCGDFAEAMTCANTIADVAEREQHHPELYVCWDSVTATIWTHSLGGLSENDFILAAKIDVLMGTRGTSARR